LAQPQKATLAALFLRLAFQTLENRERAKASILVKYAGALTTEPPPQAITQPEPENMAMFGSMNALT
jgi:hypothetical protein